MARRAEQGLLAGYKEFLGDLKEHIRSAQIKAAVSVNRELITLYWEIGKGIVERQEQAGWGDEIVDRLSVDLIRDFPEMKGFSRANLYWMRAFFIACRGQPEFVAQVVRQIPWGHNLIVFEKLKDPLKAWMSKRRLKQECTRSRRSSSRQARRFM